MLLGVYGVCMYACVYVCAYIMHACTTYMCRWVGGWAGVHMIIRKVYVVFLKH